MKLQNLTIIFIIIIIPVVLLLSYYISTGIKTIKYQSLYDTGLLNAVHDAIYAFELNTTNSVYSDNAETKRNILKSSIKAFEKSLCNTCNISSYNTEEIEGYIPALVFGMYDGFYMYAPSLNVETGEYEHSLKNYVYYSETLSDGTVIRYSLDNYIVVSGYFNGKYETVEGYLIDTRNSSADGTVYKGVDISEDNENAIKYYKEAYYFTNHILNDADWDVPDYLNPNNDKNDPEDENSSFVQHKREIMKKKIESVLNSSITAYSERKWGQTYKMPKLSVDDWEKIYSNISMIAFFQGKDIGLTKYNGYCVLNSTNNNEYVNPNLMYFINDEENYYHNIRCEKIESDILTGYKIGSFQKRKVEVAKTDAAGNVITDSNGDTEYEYAYEYNHKELACYNCINGTIDTTQSIYEYIWSNDVSPEIQTSYWTSIAKERYNTSKLLDTQCVITYELNGLTYSGNVMVVPIGSSFTTTITPVNSLTHRRPDEIIVMMGSRILEENYGYTYNNVNGEIVISSVTGDITIVAETQRDTSNISFGTAQTVTTGQSITANIDQSYRVRVFKFTPRQTGTYRFWSEDIVANTRATDPYAYLYDGSQYTVDQLDALALTYAQTGDAWGVFNNNTSVKCLIYNDDGGEGYNFSMQYNCNAGNTYYLVIRTYTSSKIQNFAPIYINKIS